MAYRSYSTIFGVGYSSLSYLTSFPFEKVKVDRSLIEKIDRPEAKTVIALIVQLSQTLKLASCAEGIETEKQLRDVTSPGIELGQGHLFGKPIPLAKIDFSVVHAWRADSSAGSSRKRALPGADPKGYPLW